MDHGAISPSLMVLFFCRQKRHHGNCFFISVLVLYSMLSRFSPKNRFFYGFELQHELFTLPCIQRGSWWHQTSSFFIQPMPECHNSHIASLRQYHYQCNLKQLGQLEHYWALWGTKQTNKQGLLTASRTMTGSRQPQPLQRSISNTTLTIQ